MAEGKEAIFLVSDRYFAIFKVMGSHGKDREKSSAAGSSSKRDKHREKDRHSSSSSSRKHKDRSSKGKSSSSSSKNRIVDDDAEDDNEEDLWVEKGNAGAEEVRFLCFEGLSMMTSDNGCFLPVNVARFNRKHPYP